MRWFRKDTERIQTMLKPSGNMCKGADKAMAHQIRSRQNRRRTSLGDNRGVPFAVLPVVEKNAAAAAMMEGTASASLR
jgi:hypothetical protein